MTYVDIDSFGSIGETVNPEDIIKDIKALRGSDPTKIISVDPSEIAYFSAELPETIVLNQIPVEVGQ